MNTRQLSATHTEIPHEDQSRLVAMFNYRSTLGKDLKTNKHLDLFVQKVSLQHL